MFTNTPNKQITHDGETIFLSRSVAVVVICMDIINGDAVFVKRGPAMDRSGTYCFPCGYLDYDESCEQAAVRELYEETGLVIAPEKLTMLSVRSDPQKSNRQNVSIVYVCNYKDTEKSDHKPDPSEVEEVTWFSRIDKTAGFAFNHETIFEEVVVHNDTILSNIKKSILSTQQKMEDDFSKLKEKSTFTESGEGFLWDYLFNYPEYFDWNDFITNFGQTPTSIREADKFNQPT